MQIYLVFNNKLISLKSQQKTTALSKIKFLRCFSFRIVAIKCIWYWQGKIIRIKLWRNIRSFKMGMLRNGSNLFKCCINMSMHFITKKGGDLTRSYDKISYTNRMSKGQSDNTNNATKSSITQGLRTDKDRSIGVTTATNLRKNQ